MKKLFALLLALAMVLSCMAGCSAPAEKAEEAPAATKAPAAAADPQPEAKEVVNIHVFQRGSNGNPSEAEVIAAMNEYSAEKIGVTITFEAVAAAEFTEGLSRKLAAKDPLDVTFVASYTGFDDFVNKGGLMDITEMLKDEQFKALVDVMPENIWQASAVAGKNYCVPNYKETPFAQTLITPKALADTIKEKYNIDFNALEVKSFRDLPKLEEYLLACQAEGIKYPMLTNEIDMALPRMLQSDPVYELVGTNTNSPYVINKETKVVSNMFENPDFASYFETMERWNELGLWSEDNLSMDWDPRDYVNRAEYGLYPCNAIPDNAAQQSITFGHDVYSINITPATILSTGALGSTWAIAAHTENAEAAMKWIQLVETDKTYADLFIYGIEGVHYTRDSEDVVTKIPDSGWSMGTWKTTCFETPSIQSTQSPDLKQQYRDFNAQGVLGLLPGFTPNYGNIESEVAAVSAIFNEEYHLYTLGYYTAENLPDTVARYKAAGDDKIIAELQQQIDAFLAG